MIESFNHFFIIKRKNWVYLNVKANFDTLGLPILNHMHSNNEYIYIIFFSIRLIPNEVLLYNTSRTKEAILLKNIYRI